LLDVGGGNGKAKNKQGINAADELHFLQESGAHPQGSLDKVLSLNLVLAFTGGRPLIEDEEYLLRNLKGSRGLKSSSDLLNSLTNQYFAPEVAKDLWAEILQHKYEVSKVLKRTARIAVTTLDYLSNITINMNCAILVNDSYGHREGDR